MDDNHSTARKMLRKSDLRSKRSVRLNDEVEELVACDSEMRTLDKLESEEKLTVFRTYMSLLKPLFSARSKVIESIPKFWATVIEYHPKLTCLLSDEESEVLQYVKKLEVENTDTTNFKITLVFDENPYIENKVLIKEFSSSSDREVESVTTPVNWKRNPIQKKSELKTEASRKRKSENKSFFTWFCNDDGKDKELIVNCFDEVWQNPLPFFLLGVMDNEVGDFDDVGECDVDPDTSGKNDDGDESVFSDDDTSSESMDDEDCWSEDDEDEAEDREGESDFEEEDERDEDMEEDDNDD